MARQRTSLRATNKARQVENAIQALQRTNAALEAENRALRTELATARIQLVDVQRELARLRQQLEQALARLSACQRPEPGVSRIAPFRKDTHVEKPRKPGRKPGRGRFAYRLEPTPTEPPIEVERPRACARCGSRALTLTAHETVTITDLPPLPQPIVQPYRVPICRCSRCQARVRGTHPDLAHDQHGATAHRFGPRTTAAVLTLGIGHHLSWARACRILAELLHLSIDDAAALKQATQAVATGGPLAPIVEQIHEAIGTSEYAYLDATSWAIGRQAAQMVALEAIDAQERSWVLYDIVHHHTASHVREILGLPPESTPHAPVADRQNNECEAPTSTNGSQSGPARASPIRGFAGILKTDRLPMYDAQWLRATRQDKCLQHARRSVKAVLLAQHPGARSFGRSLLHVFRRAESLWRQQRQGTIPLSTYHRQAGDLLQEAAGLLRDRRLKDRQNQRLLDGLGNQWDRGRLLGFLRDPRLEPTNNRAERALRPAVMSRKTSHGSRTLPGARTFAALKSVVETLRRNTNNLYATLTALLQGHPAPLSALPLR